MRLKVSNGSSAIFTRRFLYGVAVIVCLSEQPTVQGQTISRTFRIPSPTPSTAVADDDSDKSLLLRETGEAGFRVGMCSFGNPDIREVDLLAERTPSPTSLKVPEKCRAAAEEMAVQWRNEDVANWRQISNRACAAQQGWVEYHPGTCQAGGPPPICPRKDHWYQGNGAQARADFQALEKKVRLERLAQMVEASCGCWRAALEAEQKPMTNQIADRSPAVQQPESVFTVPCNSGKCPPPYTCDGTVCRPPNAFSVLMGDAKDAALDHLIEMARDGLLDMTGLSDLGRIPVGTMIAPLVPFARAWFEAVHVAPVGIVADLLSPTPISTEYEAYTRQLSIVGGKLRRMMYLQRQVALNGAFKDTQAEISHLREELNSDVQFLNEYYRGATVERQLGPNACYNVFEFQHQNVLRGWAYAAARIQ